jgi:endo-1,4-beta-xylanase
LLIVDWVPGLICLFFFFVNQHSAIHNQQCRSPFNLNQTGSQTIRLRRRPCTSAALALALNLTPGRIGLGNRRRVIAGPVASGYNAPQHDTTLGDITALIASAAASSSRSHSRRTMHIARPVVVAVALSVSLLGADTPAEIPLWPNGAPGSEGKAAKELVTTSTSGELSVAGIHNPSITPYLPANNKATGTAILVIPGGGHRVLAITHEGYNVAGWLADRGIAAFVLKHRLAREAGSTYKIEVESFADTQRAMRLIRSRAQEWGIDPARVGAMGFSAGGELVNAVATRFDDGHANAADAVERQRSRPDFQGLIYPGRSADIQPTKDFPPAFLACAYNDRTDISEGLAEAYLRFKRAGVPAELHIYGSGGHGFGFRTSNQRPVASWMTRFEEWLVDAGFLRRP